MASDASGTLAGADPETGRGETSLRPAFVSDTPALARFGAWTFAHKFGELYDPRDLGAFLADAYGEDTVRAETANGAFVHRLLLDGDRLIGFVKLRRPSDYASHSDATNPIALSQLYVRPGRTGYGFGARLLDWSLRHARRAGHDAVQLSVYSDNIAAQRFYARHGFAKIAQIDFMVGRHRDDEHLYELRL